MGGAMAANLRRAEFLLTVWNRSPGRATELLGLGAAEAATARAVAGASDIVVICVSDSPDVEAVLFGTDGVAEGARSGALVVDCSTISPAASRDFGARLAEQGVAMVDAPVSGGSEGAQKGTLTIMVGGDEVDVARARPVLEAMGSSITHMGPLGAGQATKAVNQVVLCGTYLGVAEGLVLAMRNGLDPEQVVAALGGGAAASWVLENRSGRMIADEYPLGFKVSLHLKDVVIALAMARESGVAMPVAAMAAQIENGLVAQGYGDDDVSALARAIRTWSGL
ncbi:MAG: NAD(P)-dependent oxidoreductase [Chloroflexi bacterium]|jgi:3-hydroxyisobutyrate dehydrogenase|nr:NAD(P)-dependent oxidoreductase [Chloroflexota bacterium]MBA3796200.1 NAD(P)-dependent oxidoreductase [Chloroflexota bacterium]